MLESTLRVARTTKEDLVVTNEPAHERYFSGIKEIHKGKRIDSAKMMYTPVFFPDCCGDFKEHNKGTINSLLQLPEEDIDGATRTDIQR